MILGKVSRRRSENAIQHERTPQRDGAKVREEDFSPSAGPHGNPDRAELCEVGK